MKGNKKEKIRIGKKLIDDNKIILKRIKYYKEGNDYDIDKHVCEEDVIYYELGGFK